MKVWGLLAEFSEPHALLEAAHRAYDAGYRKIDAYSPFPVEGLDEALGIKRTILPKLVLVAGLLGLLSAYGLQYWVHVIDYPINAGGRPNHSWPSFVPVIFEMTILFAALCTVIGMLALNGLPRPYHPLFNVARFDHATQTNFFLCVEATDPRFELETTRDFLVSLGPTAIEEVPA
jgi:hypothetical protein